MSFAQSARLRLRIPMPMLRKPLLFAGPGCLFPDVWRCQLWRVPFVVIILCTVARTAHRGAVVLVLCHQHPWGRHGVVDSSAHQGLRVAQRQYEPGGPLWPPTEVDSPRPENVTGIASSHHEAMGRLRLIMNDTEVAGGA